METFDTWLGKVTVWRNDDAFMSELCNGRTFEQDIIHNCLTTYITTAKHIVDVGAHIGSHTLAYAKLSPTVKVYSFEPQRKLYELLTKNIQDNLVGDRVQTFQCAIGHMNTDCEMAINSIDGYGSLDTPVEYGTSRKFNLGGLSLGKGGEQVSMRTLDSMNLEGCDFIKIDVEGAEPLVLMGAIETITKYRPVVFYECNSKTITADMQAFFDLPSNLKSSHEILKELGYSITELPGNNFLAIHH